MKKGPCERCLIRPSCSTLCNDKVSNLIGEAALEENKSYQNVTLEDFFKQLHKEGMTIRKIEVTDEPM